MKSHYYFWLAIISPLILALTWPMPGFYIKPYVMYLLMVMMFLSCLKIDLKGLKEIPKNWWRFLVMYLFIFIIPVVVASFFKNNLSDLAFVGLIIAAAMPPGIAVVFLADILDGEPTKALVASTSAHLLAPLLSPFLVWFVARKSVNVDFVAMLALIAKLVIIPLVLAQIVNWLDLSKRITPFSRPLNNFLIFIILWGTTSPARAVILSDTKQFIWILMIVAGIMAGQIFMTVWFGRTRKEDVTWMILSTFKNFSLSSVIAISLFGPVALMGSVAYIILGNISLIPISIISKMEK